jgi:hypothetical protein
MALTAEEFKKVVAEEKKKPRPVRPDSYEDWGPEIDKHPISNPKRDLSSLPAEGKKP